MKKKLIAGVLAAALAVGSLSGCGSSAGSASGKSGSVVSDDSETSNGKLTLNLYIPTIAKFSEDAIKEVQKQISAYTSEKYGWNVKLNYTEMANFEQTINLAMTTDQLDVTCYFNGEGQLANYAHNNQLLDLTDMYKNASDELKNTFTDAEIKSSSMDGKLYGLPRKYQYGGTEVVVMNKKIVKDMGIDPKSIKDMDSLGKVLEQVHAKYPDIYALVPQTASDMTWFNPYIGNVGLTNYAYVERTADNKETKLKCLFDLDSFKNFCGYTRKWYNEGLIMPDAVSNTQEGSDMVSSGAAFACLHSSDIDPLDSLYDGTVVSSEFSALQAGPIDIGNLQYGISTNSKHKDESFQLLSALFTDKKLETLLAYGIEGKDYVLNDKGRADYPDGINSTNEPYGGFSAPAVYPNCLLLPTKASATYDDAKTTIDNWNNSVEVNPTQGFYFDTSKYTDFMSAYKNLEDKYRKPLLTGSIDYNDVIDEIHSELKSLNFDDVLAKTQDALDQYLAEQNK